MRYTTQHVCTLYDVSPQTVRNWTEEFSRYLSVLAVPGKGRNRLFTDDDMRVFSLIASSKDNGAVYEEIHASLASGQRGELPELPPDEANALVVSDQQQKILMLSQQALAMQTERDMALAELRKTQEEMIRLNERLQGRDDRIQQLDAQLQKLQQRVEELSREIGEAYVKGVMQTLNKKSDS